MPLFYTDLKLVFSFSLFNPETKLSEIAQYSTYKRGALAEITVGWALPFEKCILTFSKFAPVALFDRLMTERRSSGGDSVPSIFFLVNHPNILQKAAPTRRNAPDPV